MLLLSGFRTSLPAPFLRPTAIITSQHSSFPPQEASLTSWPAVSNDQPACQVQEGTEEGEKIKGKDSEGQLLETRPAGGAPVKAVATGPGFF